MSDGAHTGYYVPDEARWPIYGSIGLTLLLCGFAALLNGANVGTVMMIAGFVVMMILDVALGS